MPDRTFSALARKSSHYVEIVAIEPERPKVQTTKIMRQYGMRPAGQRTLEVI